MFTTDLSELNLFEIFAFQDFQISKKYYLVRGQITRVVIPFETDMIPKMYFSNTNKVK